MAEAIQGRRITGTRDPYAKGEAAYIVVGIDTMQPDIREVDAGTEGSFETLQEAKTYAMRVLRKRISEGMDSLARVRQIGVEIERLM